MQDSGYFIVLSLRGTNGFIEYAKFALGDQSKFANNLFEQLAGDADVSEDDVLLIELREVQQHLPINLKMRKCTLDQLGENCKLMTREIFKAYIDQK